MNVKTNSKFVKKNDIFVCIHDDLEDRHKYIRNVKDASAIIIDKDIKRNIKIPLIKVNDTNDTLFDIYNNYYGEPLSNVNLVAITGTDGKTTTAMLIKQLLDNYEDTAYLGTNGFIYRDKKFKTDNTTPCIESILKYAYMLRRDGVRNLVMEASSEGLLHNRCKNLCFTRALITNVTGDHFNVHGDFDSYLKSKLKLFSNLSNDGVAIVNIDDVSYKYIKNLNKKIITYGFGKRADFQIKNVRLFEDKTLFSIKYNNKIYNVNSPLLGNFNVYNLTLAIVCCCSFDIDISDVIKFVKDLEPVSGRVNVFRSRNGARIILDYAHTVKATFEILKFVNSIKSGNVITVVGCAGGRDSSKRRDIGKIVTKYSDKVIFTMDDPRYEDVNGIISDMICEIETSNYVSIVNRKKAIRSAIRSAKSNDIVLILGKGSDDYMAVGNKYKKYNDIKVIKKCIRSYLKKIYTK